MSDASQEADSWPATTELDSAQPRLPPANKPYLKRPVVIVWAVIAVVLIGGDIYALLRGSSSSSAQSTTSAVVADLRAGRIAQLCTLVPTSQRSKCRTDLRPPIVPIGPISAKDIAATVTVNGDRALAVLTGSICGPDQCISNHDARLPTDQGHSFDQAYGDAIGSPSSPWVIALVDQGGNWSVAGL